MKTWEQIEGTPYPLGAYWVAQDDAFNFSHYSKHATVVLTIALGNAAVVAC